MRTLVVLLTLLLPLPAAAALLEGRVVLGEAPLAGMRVEAHRTLDSSGEPLAFSAPTGADGAFHLDLEPGHYALFARDRQRGLFAFCGRNPVAVGGEPVWAGLQAVPEAAAVSAPYDDAYSGAVEGRVLFDGRPLVGAYVYLYLDVLDDLKGQGYRLSLPTGDDGAFAFDNLPESRYFLVARKRADGGRVGPVLAGDLLAIFPGNPLPVTAGVVARVELVAVKKAQDASGSETFGRGGGTTVRGVVRDGEGRPVAGLHVFAYTERVIGHQRPAALSSPTGADGVFAVQLQRPGTYYVGARELYGDSPAPGELFGMYEGSADHGLEVGGEALSGIDITVEAIDLDVTLEDL